MCAQFTTEIFLHQLEGGGPKPPRPPSGYAYAQPISLHEYLTPNNVGAAQMTMNDQGQNRNGETKVKLRSLARRLYFKLENVLTASAVAPTTHIFLFLSFLFGVAY